MLGWPRAHEIVRDAYSGAAGDGLGRWWYYEDRGRLGEASWRGHDTGNGGIVSDECWPCENRLDG